MKQNETKSRKKMPLFFVCDICDFICSKQSNYKSHLLTCKHKMKQNETNFSKENASCILDQFQCQICLENFNSRTTLWRHKKKCKLQPIINTDKTNELIQYLIKENAEFKQLLVDQNNQMAEISCKAIDNART